MPVLLAFDTATESMSIALAVRGESFVHEAAGGARASATLIPAILGLLAHAGVGLSDLDAIAFGRGPGAFTGLRTACSVAQGLAWGAGKPVLPIDTLLVVAADALEHAQQGTQKEPQDEPKKVPQEKSLERTSARETARRGASPAQSVWVAMDARMGEVYAGHYSFIDGVWTVLEAPMLSTPEALNARWRIQPPALIAGNALTAFATRLETGAAQLAPAALPRAGAMLSIARAMWARGAAVDAALALPLYLRDKVAQTTIEREAARAASAGAAAGAESSR